MLSACGCVDRLVGVLRLSAEQATRSAGFRRQNSDWIDLSRRHDETDISKAVAHSLGEIESEFWHSVDGLLPNAIRTYFFQGPERSNLLDIIAIQVEVDRNLAEILRPVHQQLDGIVIPIQCSEGSRTVNIDLVLAVGDLNSSVKAILYSHLRHNAGEVSTQSAPARERQSGFFLRAAEKECIRWAVAGKTLRDIADITEMRYRTVRYHLDEARMRHGYATNTQLFARAAQEFGFDPLGESPSMAKNGTPRAVESKLPARVRP